MAGTHNAPYEHVPGHSVPELWRLSFQARYWSYATMTLLQASGLRPGMRVLDLGSGGGDLSFLAASLVGPSGSVVGVDHAPEAIARATSRAAELGLRQVRFSLGEIESLVLDEPIDAIVGSMVLMYLRDPVVTLTRLVAQLAPGAVVAMLEMDATSDRAVPVVSPFERAVGGFSQNPGSHLWQIFVAAGLPITDLQAHSRIEAAPAAESCRETAVSPILVGAWARKPLSFQVAA
jgi:2-polyprenyl-3-methyl-5-hydroxy-6-metoxy-1,4-benzoquinol methylase